MNNKKKKIKTIENIENMKESSQDEELIYDQNVNYYIKYWKLWKENEVLLAKIKEKAFEIELMYNN